MQENPRYKKIVKEIILSAPNIDVDVFKEQIMPEFIKYNQSVTLYASSKDYALKASRIFNGNPRAGDSGPLIIIMPRLETIDATEAVTSFLGHSYFLDDRLIISDIYCLILSSMRARDRFRLKQMQRNNLFYLVFKRYYKIYYKLSASLIR